MRQLGYWMMFPLLTGLMALMAVIWVVWMFVLFWIACGRTVWRWVYKMLRRWFASALQLCQ